MEDITNAREPIAALQPKSYEFIPQQHPHTQMPPGRQLGLMAPEAGGSAELVERVPIPAEYDTTGTMVASHQPLGHQLQRFHSGIDRGGKGAATDHF
ncbi:MAG: hypothetical protein IPO56_13790 [Flavobacteriales bacterium]|nr:hypothetical protein [Flavobacteriales bacterium]